ncbi:HEAT repeat domain-containing protein [Methanimicrococcus blatticola]|uniref:HEAT repeat protein n=1 Tax=Methanimicrococcus blatticola TaxID=91560 RepID=A0A484F4V2_9EURY|nr:HEAT repeat domain-containing protein [Methanimicrococcus blatticola]MBZ3935771.1 hypothetical protein [Methanimicrococcus blatticola]MCC2508109.1 HEAT repeat domain-containing protein [Methanimicrococcus blatticola]TDQ68812.1 hypothetical protein C7391_1008 [Methanimicrococcus blatticola]
MNPDDDITFLQNKLQLIRSLQDPGEKEISGLVSLLTDPSENEIICASVYPVLQAAGQLSVDALLSVYSNFSEFDEKIQIRLSYTFSQIPETPAFVFETFLKSGISRVRQNGIIGFALLNDRRFDDLLFDVLRNDADSETAYEAAIALSGGGVDVLSEFEIILKENVMAENLREKTYMDSPTKINADNTNGLCSPESDLFHPLDKHVLAKVIEITGDIGNEETLSYLTAYLTHPDERVSRIAAESIQKIKTKTTK